MSAWRPGRSAPRDGTWVLAFVETRINPPRPAVAKFIPAYGGKWLIAEHACAHRDTVYDVCVKSITHWQPLPEPPESK